MYIDPWAGTLWWQVLVATCVGLLYYIRKLILQVMQFGKSDRKQADVERKER